MSLDNHQCSKVEVRDVAGFTAYMLLCLGLTILIFCTLLNLKTAPQSASPSASKQQTQSSLSTRPLKHVILFATLAILSLGTTWYYMLRFFSVSYHNWASTQSAPDECLKFGLWLRDTQLFEQAWWTAVATPARFWWTQQIFFFTTAWSVFLGREGHRRSIPHLWAFMLLGQIVAISFATNLFFLATLLRPLRQARQPDAVATAKALSRALSLLLQAAPIAITLTSVALIPYLYASPHFLTVLFIPHLLLFLPLIQGIVPSISDKGNPSSISVPDRYYTRIYLAIIVCAFCLQAKATVEASSGARGIWAISEALYEHPAVSSVGWDVIMCWVSWCMWALTEWWDGDAKSKEKRDRKSKRRISHVRKGRK